MIHIAAYNLNLNIEYGIKKLDSAWEDPQELNQL
jgi:hypothetical protein